MTGKPIPLSTPSEGLVCQQQPECESGAFWQGLPIPLAARSRLWKRLGSPGICLLVDTTELPLRWKSYPSAHLPTSSLLHSKHSVIIATKYAPRL